MEADFVGINGGKVEEFEIVMKKKSKTLWKERHFKFGEKSIKYFKSKSDMSKEKALGTIDYSDVIMVEPMEDSGTKFKVFATEREHYMNATSPEDRKKVLEFLGKKNPSWMVFED